jgi:membrane-associated phospholipid phosphatase
MELRSPILALVLTCFPAAAFAQNPPATPQDPQKPPAAVGEEGKKPTRNFASALVHNLGDDVKHLPRQNSIYWLAGGGAAALAIHPADDNLSEWAQEEHATWTGGDTYGSQKVQLPLAIGVWAVGAAAGSGSVADTGRDLLRAQISVVSWTFAIKVAAQRTRPNGDPRSFPSGHASNSFATAMVLQEHFGWKAGVPAFAVAAYTAASRVVANQHWASDVVFGAFVGMASGRTVTIHLRDTRLSLAPLAVPGGGGVLVTALR